MRKAASLWLVCAWWSGHAAAQSVHKCVAADGEVSYQSHPCGGRSRETQRWNAPPDPPPSTEQLAAQALLHERGRAESEFLSRRAGTHTRGEGKTRANRTVPQPSACEAAKASRQQTLERVGLKRTYDLLSRLDEQVRKACR